MSQSSGELLVKFSAFLKFKASSHFLGLEASSQLSVRCRALLKSESLV